MGEKALGRRNDAVGEKALGRRGRPRATWATEANSMRAKHESMPAHVTLHRTIIARKCPSKLATRCFATRQKRLLVFAGGGFFVCGG
jgi:hypothetical protein